MPKWRRAAFFFAKSPQKGAAMAKFVTAVNCIDGRTQAPVSKFLRIRFKAQYVDMITCPDPAKVLSSSGPDPLIQYLQYSAMISVAKHGSESIAVVAHHDCMTNGSPESRQKIHIQKAMRRIREWNMPASIIGLWIGRDWDIEEIGYSPTTLAFKGN